MDAGLLDTLVKLASLGASGVCIFAIFWIGWLILRLPAEATPERHQTLRMFMIFVVIIALISGVTGLVNAKFTADEISDLKIRNKTLNSQFEQYKTETSKTISEYDNAAHSIAAVVKAKELSNPTPQIRSHIGVLKSFLKRVGVGVED